MSQKKSFNRLQRIKRAQEELKKKPNSTKALLLLGNEASTPKQSIKFYKRAMRIEKIKLGKQFFHRYSETFWVYPSTKLFLQSKFSYAWCLWKGLGKREKAIKHYLKLLKYCPEDTLGVRMYIVPLLLEIERYETLIRVLNRFEKDFSATWEYTLPLLDYQILTKLLERQPIKRKKQKKKKRKIIPALEAVKGRIEFFPNTDPKLFHLAKKANQLLWQALQFNTYVPQYLKEEIALPEKFPENIQIRKPSEAIEYSKLNLHLWKKIPGAIDWISFIHSLNFTTFEGFMKKFDRIEKKLNLKPKSGLLKKRSRKNKGRNQKKSLLNKKKIKNNREHLHGEMILKKNVDENMKKNESNYSQFRYTQSNNFEPLLDPNFKLIEKLPRPNRSKLDQIVAKKSLYELYLSCESIFSDNNDNPFSREYFLSPSDCNNKTHLQNTSIYESEVQVKKGRINNYHYCPRSHHYLNQKDNNNQIKNIEFSNKKKIENREDIQEIFEIKEEQDKTGKKEEKGETEDIKEIEEKGKIQETEEIEEIINLDQENTDPELLVILNFNNRFLDENDKKIDDLIKIPSLVYSLKNRDEPIKNRFPFPFQNLLDHKIGLKGLIKRSSKNKNKHSKKHKNYKSGSILKKRGNNKRKRKKEEKEEDYSDELNNEFPQEAFIRKKNSNNSFIYQISSEDEDEEDIIFEKNENLKELINYNENFNQISDNQDYLLSFQNDTELKGGIKIRNRDPNITYQNKNKLSEENRKFVYAKNIKTKGNEYFKNNQIKEAIIQYSKAITMIPEKFCHERSFFYSNRALCYLQLNQYHLVISDCTKAYRDNNDNLKALFRRAQAFLAISVFSKAQADVKEILKIDPSNKYAKKLSSEIEKKKLLQLLNQKRIKKSHLTKSNDYKIPIHPTDNSKNGIKNINKRKDKNKPMEKKRNIKKKKKKKKIDKSNAWQSISEMKTSSSEENQQNSNVNCKVSQNNHILTTIEKEKKANKECEKETKNISDNIIEKANNIFEKFEVHPDQLFHYFEKLPLEDSKDSIQLNILEFVFIIHNYCPKWSHKILYKIIQSIPISQPYTKNQNLKQKRKEKKRLNNLRNRLQSKFRMVYCLEKIKINDQKKLKNNFSFAFKKNTIKNQRHKLNFDISSHKNYVFKINDLIFNTKTFKKKLYYAMITLSNYKINIPNTQFCYKNFEKLKTTSNDEYNAKGAARLFEVIIGKLFYTICENLFKINYINKKVGKDLINIQRKKIFITKDIKLLVNSVKNSLDQQKTELFQEMKKKQEETRKIEIELQKKKEKQEHLNKNTITNIKIQNDQKKKITNTQNNPNKKPNNKVSIENQNIKNKINKQKKDAKNTINKIKNQKSFPIINPKKQSNCKKISDFKSKSNSQSANNVIGNNKKQNLIKKGKYLNRRTASNREKIEKMIQSEKKKGFRPTATLWVGSLSSITTSEDLRKLFQKKGKVCWVRMFFDKGYAFVDFENVESAINARTELSGYMLGGSRLTLGYGKVSQVEVKKSKLRRYHSYTGSPTQELFTNGNQKKISKNSNRATAEITPTNKNINNNHPKHSLKKILKDNSFSLKKEPLAFFDNNDLVGYYDHSGKYHQSKTLWIGNVKPPFTEKKLNQVCSNFGKITSINIIRETFCAFINFAQTESLIKAYQQLNGKIIKGMYFGKINIAKPSDRLDNENCTPKQVRELFLNYHSKHSIVKITGLSNNTRISDLKSFFKLYKIMDRGILINRTHFRGIYQALIAFSSKKEVEKVIEKKNNQYLGWKVIKITHINNSKKEREGKRENEVNDMKKIKSSTFIKKDINNSSKKTKSSNSNSNKKNVLKQMQSQPNLVNKSSKPKNRNKIIKRAHSNKNVEKNKKIEKFDNNINKKEKKTGKKSKVHQGNNYNKNKNQNNKKSKITVKTNSKNKELKLEIKNNKGGIGKIKKNIIKEDKNGESNEELEKNTIVKIQLKNLKTKSSFENLQNNNDYHNENRKISKGTPQPQKGIQKIKIINNQDHKIEQVTLRNDENIQNGNNLNKKNNDNGKLKVLETINLRDKLHYSFIKNLQKFKNFKGYNLIKNNEGNKKFTEGKSYLKYFMKHLNQVALFRPLQTYTPFHQTYYSLFKGNYSKWFLNKQINNPNNFPNYYSNMQKKTNLNPVKLSNSRYHLKKKSDNNSAFENNQIIDKPYQQNRLEIFSSFLEFSDLKKNKK
ncbi:tetratricopeptide repeat protein [Anaeramoeba flamelloides]|uniref:Tetratricopeptide repeat protein n=1 Tax=Anaeramoeba flamelloides TaxID=1746091 RepID=A0AAV7Y615_9EUKA|nr:tetratricopeptide repeat protein [Anaeramoeba flamelloides]